jgi:predicted amidohydrolase
MMNVTLAQIRLKTGDFEFNYNSIASVIGHAQGDLIVLPRVDLECLGGKDLCLDEKCRTAQADLYRRIAVCGTGKTVLLGDILIKDGKTFTSDDGFFEIDEEKVFVSDEYRTDTVCDLYVLAKNNYYTLDNPSPLHPFNQLYLHKRSCTGR